MYLPQSILMLSGLHVPKGTPLTTATKVTDSRRNNNFDIFTRTVLGRRLGCGVT